MVLYSFSKVTERHLVLRDNLGTFTKEGEAFDLLTTFVISFTFIDLLLAVANLKWLHP